MSVQNNTFSIALLIETSSQYGRQILKGIQRFIKSENQQHWIAVIEERDLNAAIPGWLNNWSGDGVISRHTTDELADQLKGKNVALVDLTDRNEPLSYPTVRSDDEEIGRSGAQHLHERGLNKFAFCGFRGEFWSSRRQKGFEDFVNQMDDCSFHTMESDWFGPHGKRWEEEKAVLTDWLKNLPKPIGVMACNDIRGKQVIDCCYSSGISVPESVAVVGVDNDELLCDFCHTPLSSVMPNAESVGFHGARILAEMLEGSTHKKHAAVQLVRPLGVFSRRSSDIVAVDDAELATALRYIRDNACCGISVADVISATGMSRSSIERKFRNVIQRSPQQEIRRVQLQKVCGLLSGTSRPIEAIALECGYDHPEYLHVVFKREFDMTPGEYRNTANA